jgi:hypothetical protein
MGSHPLHASRFVLSAVTALALAALSSAQGSVPLVVQREARLLGHDTQPFDGFGLSLASSGSTAIVGAPGASGLGGAGAGAAYVYVRTPSGWIEQAKLVASDAAPMDYFGAAVAIEGDIAAVSASHASPGGVPLAGSVYVFERTGSTWTQTQKLVGVGADIGEGVGWSLALEGDTLVAGAADDHHSGGQFDGGAAYVFVRGPAGWTQQQRVTAGDGEAFDYFGHALALDGDRLAVGAYSDNHAHGANGGSVYVFERSGAAWTLAQKLVPADNASNDQFGFSLALEGATLIAGAVGDTIQGAFSAGSAYVFERNFAGWTQTQKLDSPTPGEYENFGASLALDGEWLLVGVVAGENATVPLAGSVQVLQRATQGFGEEFALRTTVVEPGAEFGFSIALEDGIALVGAPGDDLPAGQNLGSVYTYRLEPAVETYCVAKVNSLGCTPAIGWSGTASPSSGAPFLVTAELVVNQKNGLLFYGYAFQSAPFQGGTLCVAAPTRRTPLQGSGGNLGVADCSGTFAFDFNAWLQAGHDPELFAGSEVFAQYWYRDPQASFATGLTDGLHAHVLP